MDGFPEAFTRFEEVVDVDEIRSFQQLRSAFSSWADRKWRETPKQMMALRVEAEKRGIPVPKLAPRHLYLVRISKKARPITWRHEVVTARRKPQPRCRDPKTGRFIKPSQLNFTVFLLSC